MQWLPNSDDQTLEAVCDRFTLRLQLNPSKPLVIQGKDGVSRKGPEPGNASHYISFTRLAANGELTYNNRQYSLAGLAWMDHEFFTQLLDNTQAGWDWFAIQLNNNEELMLYRLRKKSGKGDPYSSGTYIDSQGEGAFSGWFAIYFFRRPENGRAHNLVSLIQCPGRYAFPPWACSYRNKQH